IGQQVSGGCIRMHNTHIQYVFQHVTIGTAVTITD
ncbi:MAG: L,D-transpeptidase family protein, partial [Peptococcaceae bacterium]|nr:L,D-transpeptidase family protein [Peptococcaceae bacterium]